MTRNNFREAYSEGDVKNLLAEIKNAGAEIKVQVFILKYGCRTEFLIICLPCSKHTMNTVDKFCL